MQPSYFSPCGPPPVPSGSGPCFDVPYRFAFRSELEDGQNFAGQVQVADDDADFYLCQMTVWGDEEGVTFRIRDAAGYYLSSRPLRAEDPGGFCCDPAKRIARGSRLSIEIVNGSGLDINPRVIFNGFKRYYGRDEMNQFWPAPANLGNVANTETPPGFRDDFFIYVLNVPLVSASSVLTDQTVKIDADADFIWRSLAFMPVAGPGEAGNIAIRFQDAEGYFRMNARILLGQIAGQSSNPSPIFPEIIAPRNRYLTFELENTSGDDVENLQLLLFGVKRYGDPCGV